MLDRVGSIAAASPLPVSADLQSGYGASPEEVGETIAAAIRAGVVGANIEDYSGNPAQALFAQHTVAIGQDLIGNLVGFDDKQDVALVDARARRDTPLDHHALGHGQTELRHAYDQPLRHGPICP